MKIMIVDDHTEMRKVLRSVVSSGNGHEIIECADGEEAVKEYALHHPDVVVMDVQLKNMNGFTATEKIFEQDPNASVIFVTSHNTQVFRNKAEHLHAKGFVTKDNLIELEQLIHQLS